MNSASYAGGKWLNKNVFLRFNGARIKTSSAACIWFGSVSSGDKEYLKDT